MRSVALSVISGKNYILGTFDVTGFQTWWKSEPFPGNVDIIQEPLHVYGQYHVCIVKMVDGTYSIYRTKNMGKSWESVYNTTDIIYTLTRIDYGWIIASTSTGWIESRIDSGYTWSRLSSFAPSCKTVINISDDILWAHDGTNIWKSEDYGKTWSLKLSKTKWWSRGWHDKATKSSESARYFYCTDFSYPALAGSGNFILVGFGPYLVISEDGGETWFTHFAGWTGEDYMDTWASIGGPFNPDLDTKIIQIIHTGGTDAQITTEKSFMLRLTRLVYNKFEGEQTRHIYMYSGPLYILYYNKEYFPEFSPGFVWKEVHRTSYSGDPENGKLSSYDVMIPGTNSKTSLVTANLYDSNNNPVVIMSVDGGSTLTYPDVANVTVYEGDPAQEIFSPTGQQVFDEEFWTTYTWVGSACHNNGKYVVEYNKTIRGISIDTDLMVNFVPQKQYFMTMSTNTAKNHTYTCDALVNGYFYKNLSVDLLIRGLIRKTLLMDVNIINSFNKTCAFDVVNSAQKTCPVNLDSLLRDTFLVPVYYDAVIKNTCNKNLEMGLKIIDTHVDEIMNLWEKYSPQLPDVRYPDIGYKPWNSRNEGVNL